MITLRTELRLKGVTGQQITDFMLNCTDEEYQRWWPGTHLAFHTIKQCPGDIGNLVFMDEYVGERRLMAKAVVKQIDHGKKIVWKFVRLVRLPVRLILELEDQDDGLLIRHTVTAGFKGLGRICDPLLRIYFTRRFAKDLDEHVRTEFPMLRDMLSSTSDSVANGSD